MSNVMGERGLGVVKRDVVIPLTHQYAPEGGTRLPVSEKKDEKKGRGLRCETSDARVEPSPIESCCPRE